MIKEQEIREKFQKFADNILWSNDNGDEKYIGVGNMADWWLAQFKEIMEEKRKKIEAEKRGFNEISDDYCYSNHDLDAKFNAALDKALSIIKQ